MAQKIKSVDTQTIHQLTSGQVVIDLQTAVKELVENSLDAGATSIDIRFKDYGAESVEVVDNGSGIASGDYEAVALKHHTSKLSSFHEISSVLSFGFRGEALSSLCALCETVTVITATATEAPMGTVLEFDKSGELTSKGGRIARQKGTTVTFVGLFKFLPVRRKELERNVKREFGKALNLLNAYALVPCVRENRGVRLSCSNLVKGRKTVHLRTDGSSSSRSSASAIWGAKSLENIVDLDLDFSVETEKSVLRRQGLTDKLARNSIDVRVHGLISKFIVGGGRSGTDRQFFYVNGRPCSPSKVQKAFNEVYRTFNIHQSPFIVANFIVPTDALDINVSPDKRTIFIHSENSLVQALKIALEKSFSHSRATYGLNYQTTTASTKVNGTLSCQTPLFNPEDDEEQPAGSPEQKEWFGDPILLTGENERIHVDDDGAELNIAIPTSLDTEQDTVASHDRHMSPTATQMQVDKTELPLHHVARCASIDVDLNPSPTRSARTSTSFALSKRPPSSSHSERGVQMVLNTQNASWNLRRSTDSDSDHMRKRRKRDEDTARNVMPPSSNKDLLTHLVDFARSGSQVTLRREAEGECAGSDGRSEEGEVVHTHAPTGSEDRSDDPDDCMIDVNSTSEPASLEDYDDVPGPLQDQTILCDDTSVIVSSQDGGIDNNFLPDTSSHVDDGDERTASSSSRGAPAAREVIHTVDADDVLVRLNLGALTASWQRLGKQLTALRTAPTAAQRSSERQTMLARDAGFTSPEVGSSASAALSRVLAKADFLSMEVVGQFNKGFIITRLRKGLDGSCEVGSAVGPLDDLFIVDQHAADEKYNFERLQAMTKIEAQKLYRPLPLELTAADEIVALDNMDILHENGFEVIVGDESADGGHRLSLVAQPISKNTVFDMKDLEELIHLMHDQPRGQMVRCSKARTMFAMRACRSSVMVGTALKAQQMLSVVKNMGSMDQPWHCPHGRPTMRHLSDITGIGWNRGGPGTVERRGFLDFNALL